MASNNPFDDLQAPQRPVQPPQSDPVAGRTPPGVSPHVGFEQPVRNDFQAHMNAKYTPDYRGADTPNMGDYKQYQAQRGYTPPPPQQESPYIAGRAQAAAPGWQAQRDSRAPGDRPTPGSMSDFNDRLNQSSANPTLNGFAVNTPDRQWRPRPDGMGNDLHIRPFTTDGSTPRDAGKGLIDSRFADQTDYSSPSQKRADDRYIQQKVIEYNTLNPGAMGLEDYKRIYGNDTKRFEASPLGKYYNEAKQRASGAPEPTGLTPFERTQRSTRQTALGVGEDSPTSRTNLLKIADPDSPMMQARRTGQQITFDNTGMHQTQGAGYGGASQTFNYPSVASVMGGRVGGQAVQPAGAQTTPAANAFANDTPASLLALRPSNPASSPGAPAQPDIALNPTPKSDIQHIPVSMPPQVLGTTPQPKVGAGQPFGAAPPTAVPANTAPAQPPLGAGQTGYKNKWGIQNPELAARQDRIDGLMNQAYPKSGNKMPDGTPYPTAFANSPMSGKPNYGPTQAEKYASAVDRINQALGIQPAGKETHIFQNMTPEQATAFSDRISGAMGRTNDRGGAAAPGGEHAGLINDVTGGRPLDQKTTTSGDGTTTTTTKISPEEAARFQNQVNGIGNPAGTPAGNDLGQTEKRSPTRGMPAATPMFASRGGDSPYASGRQTALANTSYRMPGAKASSPVGGMGSGMYKPYTPGKPYNPLVA